MVLPQGGVHLFQGGSTLPLRGGWINPCFRIIGSSDYRTLGLSNLRTIEQPPKQEPSNRLLIAGRSVSQQTDGPYTTVPSGNDLFH